jgi:hypothetical protein
MMLLFKDSIEILVYTQRILGIEHPFRGEHRVFWSFDVLIDFRCGGLYVRRMKEAGMYGSQTWSIG